MSNSEELLYRIALPLLEEVGQKRAKDLYIRFGSAKAVFSLNQNDFQQHTHLGHESIVKLINSKDKALKRASEELAFIERHKIEVYFFQEDNYPYRLRECVDAPLLLYGKGNLAFNQGHLLSIVGTRMPTEKGKELCRKTVLDLAAMLNKITIVSGLAYGIDVTAHRAALEAGIPTIIIPGHGLDRIYPAVHRKTAVEALENGGILTEYMSGTQPDRQNFIARNRIIAGISDATLVVESKEKGGSLITADMAASYSRDVFAFPGRPSDVCSKGCNILIKNQKAALVESAQDIIMAMQWDANKPKEIVQTSMFDDLPPLQANLLEILKKEEEGLHVNQLVMALQKPYNEIIAELLQMEFAGLVKALPGGIYISL